MICEGSDASCNWNSNRQPRGVAHRGNPKLFYFDNKIQGFGMLITHV